MLGVRFEGLEEADAEEDVEIRSLRGTSEGARARGKLGASGECRLWRRAMGEAPDRKRAVALAFGGRPRVAPTTCRNGTSFSLSSSDGCATFGGLGSRPWTRGAVTTCRRGTSSSASESSDGGISSGERSWFGHSSASCTVFRKSMRASVASPCNIRSASGRFAGIPRLVDEGRGAMPAASLRATLGFGSRATVRRSVGGGARTCSPPSRRPAPLPMARGISGGE